MMKIFGRLTVRIFTIFFLTVVFFLILIITIPSLDSRNLTYLSTQEMTSGRILATSIEKKLTNIPKKGFQWWMRFINVMDDFHLSGQSLYIVTPTDQIITSDTTNTNIINNFIKLTNKADMPVKKIYDSKRIVGPFLMHYDDETYRLFIIQTNIDSQSELINFIFDHPFLLLALTALISSPLLLWLSWSLAKPARRLKAAAEQVAKGNLTELPELETFSTYEFKATGASFNHMLRELKRMQDLQQRLLSDISHELRTPLTRLQLAVSLSRRKYGENKEIERIELEAKQLDSMIRDLLSLARQQYTINKNKELYQINELLQPVIDNAIFEAEQSNKTLYIVSELPTKTIYCHAQTLCSAVENVIRNAFRYSNKLIDVDFRIEHQQLIITIDDDGIGVEKDKLGQIFRPFYRTCEARDRESGGIGLGLAIVENAITQENGTVHAEKSQLGGLRIVIALPLHKKSVLDIIKRERQ